MKKGIDCNSMWDFVFSIMISSAGIVFKIKGGRKEPVVNDDVTNWMNGG